VKFRKSQLYTMILCRLGIGAEVSDLSGLFDYISMDKNTETSTDAQQLICSLYTQQFMK
jgi:hypothetical protein